MNQLIEMNHQLTMGTREIAELLGKRHDNIKASALKLADSGVISTPVEQEFEHRGNFYTELMLCKRDCFVLVAQNCPEFTAKIIDRWQELETKRVSKPLIDANIAGIAAFIEIAGRSLNMSNSAKLGMFQKAQAELGIPSVLPSYAIDAPSGAAGGSSHATKSLTDILKDSGVNMSARVANLVLADAGIIERKERPSSKGGTKKFWSITELGMEYGKNVTSPNNPRETQPHFYESAASDLILIVTNANKDGV